VSRDSVVDDDWLPATVRCQHYLPCCQPSSDVAVSCTECTFQGNDFELIPTVKMETRNSVKGFLVVNFRRCVIIAELRRPEVARR